MKKSIFISVDCANVSREMLVISELNQYFMKQNAPFFLTARLLLQHTLTASFVDNLNL
jgi:hypothetical protein